MNQKGFFSIATVLIIVGILIIVGGVLYWQNQKEKPSACTQDAKLCPDGSYVSRTGPNCEFAPCPSSAPTSTPSVDTSNWQTYRNEEYGFEVKYPETYFFQENSYGVKILNKAEDEQKTAYYKKCNANRDELCPPFAEIKSTTIKIFNNSNNLSTAEWLKQNEMFHQFEKTCQLNSINGYCGLDGTLGGADSYFYLNINKKIVQFSNMGAADSQFLTMINDLIKNQILSTFKFTK